MIPWRLLDTALIPGGGGELRLKKRGTEFSIMQGQIELMNSRLHGSEEALARLAWDRIRDHPRPRMLIGGLGMGFTLRAALAECGPAGHITVAELVPAVIAWARGPLADLFEGSVDDPRVDIRDSDVGLLIKSARATYDAILLDVDNGPEGLSRRANDRLYDREGLDAARRALTPGGVLAVWSSGPNASFTQRLRQSGFGVDEIQVRADRKGRGARHTIWLGERSESTP